MSGFVGIVPGRGALDRDLLRRMTDSLVFRGPDGQSLWSSDEAGFGHTLFKTTFESEREKQPCTLDGNAWITADCRIDGQEDLRAKLSSQGRRVALEATDPELILHAWHVWGENCVEHLLGDFAFAIWDGRRKRLFCARDHWGIKLFYYSTANGTLVFSNTMNCVKMAPGVTDRWNDVALCDFLMFGHNWDPGATTMFADIVCLPPAHVMTWETGELKLRRYWTLPIDEPIRFGRQRDYVDRFHELLATAVRDRLRTDKAAVMMSGGLDSTILAATAKRVMSGSAFDLSAHTVVYSEPIPDPELPYSEMAARHIGIPHHLINTDVFKPYERWDELAPRMPEPEHSPGKVMRWEFNQQIASHSRVALYGEGPDNLLRYEWKPYLAYLRNRGQYGYMAIDLTRSFWAQKRVPLFFFARRRSKAAGGVRPAFPPWIKTEIAQKLNLHQRWNSFWEPMTPVHPYHPHAYNSMGIANWVIAYISTDSSITGALYELRHPYLDLRVARYLLSVPVLPWCRHKHLLREAARDLLPEPLCRRQKTPLPVDFLSEYHKTGKLEGLEPPAVEVFSQYVTWWPKLESGDPWSIYLSLIPISLGWWWKAKRK
jgi:asparagine synthase (glutamine-hydrolysing)